LAFNAGKKLLLPRVTVNVDLFLVKAFFRSTAAAVANQFVAALTDLGDNLRAGFPNPVRMFDAFLRFGTTLGGIATALPSQTQLEFWVDFLRKAGIANKVMTAEQAVRAMFGSVTAYSQAVTQTGENGLAEWIAQRLGMFIYHFVKKWKFIYKLIGAKSEAEIVRLIVGKLTGGARRLFWLYVISFALFLVQFMALEVLFLGFGLSLLTGSFQKRLLSQDSKRVYARKKGKLQFRVNERTGPDRPAAVSV